jgi:hypothetical protein
MRLEDRMRQSVRRRSGNVILRADVARLGSATQVSHGLEALLGSGELLRLGEGIYAKTRLDNKQRTLAVDFESMVQEVAQRLGLSWRGLKPSAPFGTDHFVAETDKPRISRKLTIHGKTVQFQSSTHPNSAQLAHRPLDIPVAGVAHYVASLARRFKVSYTPNPMDQWAETVTRLAGDTVEKDHTQDLLVALKRSGKLSAEELARLTINYLREKKQRV